jgi:hypothetical protein
VSVHLFRQLAGDLDRLNLRRERAAEDPLDEVLNPLLQVSQNADLGSSGVAGRRARAVP